jgi:hypothetical protein
MREFDITCTATLRPELLRRTFMSHTHNLFKEDISNATLHINIDYVGGENKKDCAKRLDDIFQIIDVDIPFRNINVNVSYDPDFSKAFFWCMDQIRSTDLFFHLEEDWELNLELDWGRMVGLFDEDQSLAHLRLSAFPSTSYRLKNWNKFNDWNGKYFEVPVCDRGVTGWAGHPSLNRTEFINMCMEYADRSKNAEKQIKGRRYSHPMNAIMNAHRFGVYHPQNSPRAVNDIGREWMTKHGFVKSGNKAFFTQWERTRN